MNSSSVVVKQSCTFDCFKSKPLIALGPEKGLCAGSTKFLIYILYVWQLAGVQCAGNPHFWVNEDGSYQEEGQKNTRGFIWGKVVYLPVCL